MTDTRIDQILRRLRDVLLVLAPLFIVAALWLWVDLNEELADMPPWRALPLTVRLWRWSLTFYGLASAALAATVLPCTGGVAGRALCQTWLEAPAGLHGVMARVLGFIFGATWTPGVAAFVGYVTLVAYGVGMLQWLPRGSSRVAHTSMKTPINAKNTVACAMGLHLITEG